MHQPQRDGWERNQQRQTNAVCDEERHDTLVGLDHGHIFGQAIHDVHVQTHRREDHADLAAGDAVKFKEGDGAGFAFHAHTTDKIIVAASDGRFYTLGADKLPGARGFGEPIRTMVDIDAGTEIIEVLVYKPKAQLLLASNTGRGLPPTSTASR